MLLNSAGRYAGVMFEPLVLDLDGVLRVWDPAIIADAERDNGLPQGSLVTAAFGDPQHLHDAITGAVTDEQWREQISARLEGLHGPGARSAVAQWSIPAGQVDEQVLNIVRRERKRRTIALFSNATTRLESDLARLGLANEVDVVFNSSVMGMAKPSHEAFSTVLTELGAAPGECLFVDDTLINTQSAGRAGYKVHHFTSPVGLEEFIASSAAKG